MTKPYYAVFLALFITPASADWYAGVGAGMAHTDDYCQVEMYASEPIECRRERSPSYRAFLGHEWSRYFRAEIYSGEIGSASVIDRGVGARDTGSVEVGGIGVAIMPGIAVSSKLDIYLRAGYLRSYTSEHLAASRPAPDPG